MRLQSVELARQIASLASDRKAEGVLVLDLRACTSITDYFVICSGASSRQIQAITDEVEEALSSQGVKPLQTEGTSDSGWVLLDYGDVVLHIFATVQRAYYGLEDLWHAAIPVLRMQ